MVAARSISAFFGCFVTSIADSTCQVEEGVAVHTTVDGHYSKMTVASADECCNACSNDEKCSSWTFKASKGKCLLKTGEFKNSEEDSDCTSGFPDRSPPSPPVPPSPPTPQYGDHTQQYTFENKDVCLQTHLSDSTILLAKGCDSSDGTKRSWKSQMGNSWMVPSDQPNLCLSVGTADSKHLKLTEDTSKCLKMRIADGFWVVDNSPYGGLACVAHDPKAAEHEHAPEYFLARCLNPSDPSSCSDAKPDHSKNGGMACCQSSWKQVPLQVV